ncbi:class I SAM-dependent methyltransferase [Pseudemcibacter aquimaris]|uniref:class I SAM-dependent methyltransferase n=1 Tax=Pseudemcibacter aquimaris TaxID=2857064 RepID=UPI002011C81F|nr:hypothetical protein [Pseudemcibacter aquimaris]MCC3860462.1 hypothetical protein [Pseudemcibacter aquimaris]WDU59287.1 hypothetical protein KW060_03290 [Pseudemcibacter aquimaris]
MNLKNIDLKPPYKLNVGCGRKAMSDWVNLDSTDLDGVDIICDLENLKENPIDLPDGSVNEFLLSHVIEHINNSLGLMEELWRLATDDAVAQIYVPYGSSDNAWEDQTHVRPYFMGSFSYFSQPYYWHADYGYGGDWQPVKIQLRVNKRRCQGLSMEEIKEKISIERNIVREMVCELRAVKPKREAKRELIRQPQVFIQLVD